MKTIFTEIYNKNIWGSKESISGPGSELLQTITLRAELSKFIEKKQITKIIDAPCGDFNWMKEIINSQIDYLGIDIINSLIENNCKKYPEYKFIVGNLLNYQFPMCDLIICRDCLVHLSTGDIFTFFNNIKHCNFKFIAFTNFIDATRLNTDIKTGYWRLLNLQKHPFNFDVPYYNILENCTECDGIYTDKSLSIYTNEQFIRFIEMRRF